MARKTVRFTKEGIEMLPENKPVVYRILTDKERLNYIGVAKRGRVQERLFEHLPAGPDAIPGATVEIEPFDNLSDAKQKAAMVIRRAAPTYNTQEKYGLVAGPAW